MIIGPVLKLQKCAPLRRVEGPALKLLKMGAPRLLTQANTKSLDQQISWNWEVPQFDFEITQGYDQDVRPQTQVSLLLGKKTTESFEFNLKRHKTNI